MAEAAALTAYRDVIAELWKELRMPASCLHQNNGPRERPSDHLETALARLGDLADSVKTTSPNI